MQPGADFGEAELLCHLRGGGAAVPGEHDGAHAVSGRLFQHGAAARTDFVFEQNAADDLLMQHPDLAETDGRVRHALQRIPQGAVFDQFPAAHVAEAAGRAPAQALTGDGLKLGKLFRLDAL